MTNNFTFVGVDIETVGLDLNRHPLCQIGVAFSDHPEDVFVSDVGWDTSGFMFTYEQTALDINGFTLERIQSGPPPEEVWERLHGFLSARSEPAQDVIAVGWNFASFDLPRILRVFPGFANHFSYRTVDLNAICFALGGGDKKSFKEWKTRAQEAAVLSLGHENLHDAGWDALASLASFDWLRSRAARTSWEDELL